MGHQLHSEPDAGQDDRARELDGRHVREGVEDRQTSRGGPADSSADAVAELRSAEGRGSPRDLRVPADAAAHPERGARSGPARGRTCGPAGKEVTVFDTVQGAATPSESPRSHAQPPRVSRHSTPLRPVRRLARRHLEPKHCTPIVDAFVASSLSWGAPPAERSEPITKDQNVCGSTASLTRLRSERTIRFAARLSIWTGFHHTRKRGPGFRPRWNKRAATTDRM